jgi:hypothetical protein
MSSSGMDPAGGAPIYYIYCCSISYLSVEKMGEKGWKRGENEEKWIGKE